VLKREYLSGSNFATTGPENWREKPKHSQAPVRIYVPPTRSAFTMSKKPPEQSRSPSIVSLSGSLAAT
jgi:hypothetical protein